MCAELQQWAVNSDNKARPWWWEVSVEGRWFTGSADRRANRFGRRSILARAREHITYTAEARLTSLAQRHWSLSAAAAAWSIPVQSAVIGGLGAAVRLRAVRLHSCVWVFDRRGK